MATFFSRVWTGLVVKADGTGGVGPLLHRLVDGNLQVAGIVQSVENTDDVDAVFHGVLHELAHHIVGVVLVAQDILASQEHLQLGVGHFGADLPQPLPGILVQVAQAHIKGGAAPHLGGIIAGLVDGLQNGLKLAVRRRVAISDWFASRSTVSVKLIFLMFI